MKFYLICCMDNISDAGMIPYDDRPKFMHDYKDMAENELLRLKQRFPEREFFLFESICVAREQVTGTGIIEIEAVK